MENKKFSIWQRNSGSLLANRARRLQRRRRYSCGNHLPQYFLKRFLEWLIFMPFMSCDLCQESFYFNTHSGFYRHQLLLLQQHSQGQNSMPHASHPCSMSDPYSIHNRLILIHVVHMLGWIIRSYVFLAIFLPDLVNCNRLQNFDISFISLRICISVI